MNAQEFDKKVQLKWVNKSEIITNINTEVLELPLLDNKYFDENFIPYYFEQWNVSNNIQVDTYIISNIVYKNIDKDLYPLESHKYFPSKLTSKFIIKHARDKAFAQLKLIPLVFENGRLKKIVSFEIKYSFKQKNSNKNANSLHNS
ncbi:MAG TPA: hypothetical protein EYG80_05680, partial [Flavobacteriaceae bacterium]|nr:hypothetical protein [Flavobacteriaceae bacterium]